MAMKFSTGKRVAPIWAHVYGPEGLGKSTFGSEAPDPVFVDIEQGTNNLVTARATFDDAGDRTRPVSFAEVIGKLGELAREAHPYKTIVIDTVDALEALIWAAVCARGQVKSIEDFGYGKGYVVALNEWRQIIDAIETLRAKGYNVITLGHSLIKPFKNPEGEDFDRYIPKLHEKAGALIKERADAVLFCNYRNATRKDAQTKRVRGVTDKARLIYTSRTAAFDAKNRYDLPEEMPLRWADFFAAVQAHKPADPGALRAAILEKVATFPADLKAEALGYLEKAGGDAVKLSKLNGWCNAKTPEPEAAAVAAQPPATPEPIPTPAVAAGSAPPPDKEEAEIAAERERARAEAAAKPAPKPERKMTDVHGAGVGIVDAIKAEEAAAAKTAREAAEAAARHEAAATPAEDKSLQPGVDVPAMEAKPAPAPAETPMTPKEIAIDAIFEASEKCRTPADMLRIVLPLMKSAIDRGLFSPEEIESNRAWYVDTAARLKKEAQP